MYVRPSVLESVLNVKCQNSVFATLLFFILKATPLEALEVKKGEYFSEEDVGALPQNSYKPSLAL